MVLVVRIVEHAVEFDVVDLGHRCDIARKRTVDLDLFTTLDHEQMRNLEGFAAIADEQLGVLGHRALMHAKYSQLADERVDHHFEHMRQHVLLRVGFGVKLDRAIAFAFGKQRRIAFCRIRRELDEDVEQFGYARARSCGDKAYGHKMSLAQCLFEPGAGHALLVQIHRAIRGDRDADVIRLLFAGLFGRLRFRE